MVVSDFFCKVCDFMANSSQVRLAQAGRNGLYFGTATLHITIKVLEEINSMRCTKEIDPLCGHVSVVHYFGHRKCSRLESALTLDFLRLREGEMYSHIAILG